MRNAGIPGAVPPRSRAARCAVWMLALVATVASPVVAQPVGQAPASQPPAAVAPLGVRQVTFDEAVARALERNPTIAEAQTAVSRAQALVAQARAVTLPALSAGLSNVTLDSARGFAGGITQPQNQSAFSASASVPVFAPVRWADVSQARDQVVVAERATDDVRQQVAVTAAQTYLSVIAARRQVEVDVRALENARAHLDFATRRLEGGAGSRLNQLRAGQQVSGDEARLATTELALLRSQEALGVILAEDGPVDAGAEPSFDVPPVSSESSWMDERPDVRFQQSVRSAADRAVRDSWKEWLPSATASFDPQYLTPAGLFQPSRTWRLVFSVSQPVFEGGQRRAAERLRRAAFAEAEAALTRTTIEARSEVRTARAAVEAQERVLASARLAAQQADDVLRITTAAFEVGATTNIEVIDAQRSARDAATLATQAADAARRARLDLLVALGRFPR